MNGRMDGWMDGRTDGSLFGFRLCNMGNSDSVTVFVNEMNTFDLLCSSF